MNKRSEAIEKYKVAYLECYGEEKTKRLVLILTACRIKIGLTDTIDSKNRIRWYGSYTTSELEGMTATLYARSLKKDEKEILAITKNPLTEPFTNKQMKDLSNLSKVILQ
jgi:hypothetical protein